MRSDHLPDARPASDAEASVDTFLSRVPESDLPQLLEAVEQVTAASGTYQIEYRVKGTDGGLRTMEARGRILPGEDGRPAQMMGMVVDTTTIRAKLDAEQQRLREVADRARRMHSFTAALASAITVNAIVEAAQSGISAFGADSLILVAERDGQLKVEASCGLSDDIVDALSGLRSYHPAPDLRGDRVRRPGLHQLAGRSSPRTSRTWSAGSAQSADAGLGRAPGQGLARAGRSLPVRLPRGARLPGGREGAALRGVGAASPVAGTAPGCTSSRAPWPQNCSAASCRAAS